MALKKSKDHWAFLEEIEAPMWVDLTLEANPNYQDVDDCWFQSSHPFHQLPAGQLKAAFSHSGEECMGISSPKLPSSVSKSRGRHYAGKDRRADFKSGLFSKEQHPVKELNGKASVMLSGSGEEMKPKLCFANSRGTSRSKIGLVSRSGLAGNFRENNLKGISSHDGLENSLSTLVNKAGSSGESNTSVITSESYQQREQINEKLSWFSTGSSEEVKPKSSLINSRGISSSKICLVSQSGLTGSTKEDHSEEIAGHGGVQSTSSSMVDQKETNISTVMCESDRQPHQKNLEVSSKISVNTRELLTAVRNSLRKSCVMRQASRVEINKDRGQSSNRKSSSGKSSVGSSSNLPCGVRSSTFAVAQNKEKTPDSRNLARVTAATKKKQNKATVLKASNMEVKDTIQNSTKGGKGKVVKLDNERTTKSKVLNQSIRPKALMPHRVNEQGLQTGALKDKARVRVGAPNRLVGVGKENSAVGMSMRQNCSSKDSATGSMARGQQGTKRNMPQTSDRTGLIHPKMKEQKNISYFCHSSGKRNGRSSAAARKDMKEVSAVQARRNM